MNNCFRCDDTDEICDLCGESEEACECDESERSFSPCPECCGEEVEEPVDQGRSDEVESGGV